MPTSRILESERISTTFAALMAIERTGLDKTWYAKALEIALEQPICYSKKGRRNAYEHGCRNGPNTGRPVEVQLCAGPSLGG